MSLLNARWVEWLYYASCAIGWVALLFLLTPWGAPLRDRYERWVASVQGELPAEQPWLAGKSDRLEK